jgi:hypothetical protein
MKKCGSDEETIQHIMPSCKSSVSTKKRLVSVTQDEEYKIYLDLILITDEEM